jgi:hypothetical protein
MSSLGFIEFTISNKLLKQINEDNEDEDYDNEHNESYDNYEDKELLYNENDEYNNEDKSDDDDHENDDDYIKLSTCKLLKSDIYSNEINKMIKLKLLRYYYTQHYTQHHTQHYTQQMYNNGYLLKQNNNNNNNNGNCSNTTIERYETTLYPLSIRLNENNSISPFVNNYSTMNDKRSKKNNSLNNQLDKIYTISDYTITLYINNTILPIDQSTTNYVIEDLLLFFYIYFDFDLTILLLNKKYTISRKKFFTLHSIDLLSYYLDTNLFMKEYVTLCFTHINVIYYNNSLEFYITILAQEDE